jgi:transcription antitermination factor NusG
LLSKGGEALSESTYSPLHQPVPASLNEDFGPRAPISQHWFAVYTTPRHEKRISFHCEQRQIESYVPLYQETRQWKNRCKVKLDLPLFPNYLFVRISREERFRVLNVPGVLSILGFGHELSPMPDEYISSLRKGLDAHVIEPHASVEVGDRVRIIAGAMSGMEGILVRKKNDLRVVLKVALLERSMAVEVTMADIEYAGAGQRSHFSQIA